MAEEFLPIAKEVAWNSMEYVVSRAVWGALNVALLRAMAIQGAFSDDSFK